MKAGRATRGSACRPAPAGRSGSVVRPVLDRQARKKIPSRAIAMPTEQSIRYFQAASSERRFW